MARVRIRYSSPLISTHGRRLPVTRTRPWAARGSVGNSGHRHRAGVGDLAGSRQAERVDLHADVGDLHAHAMGVVDLLHQSAELEYAADATAMAPRQDLTWQQLHVHGTWNGPLATAAAAGELTVLGLDLPDGVHISALTASLEGACRGFACPAGGLRAPPHRECRRTWWRASRCWSRGRSSWVGAARPFELRVSHSAFMASAKGRAAGTPSPSPTSISAMSRHCCRRCQEG